MRGRSFVIGDIHGGLKALEQVLERAAVSENDQLIFLGDYVDGWSDSPGVIDRLIDLKSRCDCIFIRGNHDQLFYDWATTGKDNPLWLQHGGRSTVEAYKTVDDKKLRLHLDFLESLDNYFVDAQQRLFVHAGFTNLHGVEREYFPDMLFWDRSLWEMVLAMNPDLKEEDSRYPDRLKHYQEIFIGHTPTIRIGSTVPVNISNVWNLDTGAAYRHPLTIMNVETKEYWQSDNVDLLYPDEPGRNH